MITLDRITQQADKDGVDADVVERDYVLTHILASLSSHTDPDIFQFKGGTSLRLCYFHDYRYSADIDLNLLPDVSLERAREVLGEIVERARQTADLPHLELIGDPVTGIDFIGPKQTRRPRPIKLDITTDELVVDYSTAQPLLLRYEDQPHSPPIRVYGLGETAAEKLRCVMQRLLCRDLYDIWFLFENGGVDAEEIKPDFQAKAAHRGYESDDFGQQFEHRLEQYARRWEAELSPYVDSVPHVDQVAREVSRRPSPSRLPLSTRNSPPSEAKETDLAGHLGVTYRGSACTSDPIRMDRDRSGQPC